MFGGYFFIEEEMIFIIDFILSLIYPNICGFCGKLEKDFLCEDCENRLKKSLVYKTKDIKDKYFEKQIYLAKYDGEFREKILSYKFLDKAYMYKTFAKIIIKNKKICGIIRQV